MYTKSMAPYFIFLIYLSIREPILFGCIIRYVHAYFEFIRRMYPEKK